MNERIKQLWEDNDTIEVCYPEQGSPVSVSATTLEKFAELIVRDCMDVVYGYTKPRTFDTHYDAVEQIRVLFGVEE